LAQGFHIQCHKWAIVVISKVPVWGDSRNATHWRLSKIFLAAIAKWLMLDSENTVADSESMLISNKAIRNGAIDATIDHVKLLRVGQYQRRPRQRRHNSRIAFCLGMHNEAVKALRV
jgi:hypothetical protein